VVLLQRQIILVMTKNVINKLDDVARQIMRQRESAFSVH